LRQFFPQKTNLNKKANADSFQIIQ